MTVSLCLRDRRRETRSRNGRARADEDKPAMGAMRQNHNTEMTYLQVGLTMLRPLNRAATQGGWEGGGGDGGGGNGGGDGWGGSRSEGSEGVEKSEKKAPVECSSPLCLLPGYHRVCGRTRFWNKREVSRLVALRRGEEVVIVPSTWDAGVPYEYVLLLHQHGGAPPEDAISLTPQRSRESLHVSCVRGAWLPGQGGGVSSPAFTGNPQYLLCAPTAAMDDDSSSERGRRRERAAEPLSPATARVHLLLTQEKPPALKGGAPAALQPIGCYVLETNGCRIEGEVPPKSSFQGSLVFTNALATTRECQLPAVGSSKGGGQARGMPSGGCSVLLVPCTLKTVERSLPFELTVISETGAAKLPRTRETCPRTEP